VRIALIGPGIMPIPPQGWGGVEIFIWDCKNALENLGHQVKIFNSQDLKKVVKDINKFSPDFAHLHYDEFYHIMAQLRCKRKAITSHYPFLESPEPSYGWILPKLNKSGCSIIALTDPIKQSFVKAGGDEKNIHVMPFGIEGSDFKFIESKIKYPTRSIYLSKIEQRKRQYLFQNPAFNIDFVGNISDPSFNSTSSGYLGHWDRGAVTEKLTQYANMVLLSASEGHARVCIEGLISGLGLVVSEFATAHLDLSQPFITVIPEDKITDQEFIKQELENNRKTSLSMRKEIRKYAINNFTWKSLVKTYENIIKTINT
jgi:DNA-dependent RNA polymerase auxiliary subunit epsilon